MYIHKCILVCVEVAHARVRLMRRILIRNAFFRPYIDAQDVVGIVVAANKHEIFPGMFYPLFESSFSSQPLV